MKQPRIYRLSLWLRWSVTAVVLAVCAGRLPADEPSGASGGEALFSDYVLPLLKKNCYECHSHEFEEARGGLVVDSRNGLLKGGELGPVTQQFHTGHIVLSRPSLGSWVLYGLGTENQDIPGFLVVSPPAGTSINCGNSFLPAIYQATVLQDSEKAAGEKIRYLDDTRLPRNVRRRQLDYLQQLNASHLQQAVTDPRLEGMIESFELAFRMQQEAPEVLDTSRESAATGKLYGLDDPSTGAFGRQCLMARRLAEAGVRFIQVTSKGWDHHSDIKTNLEKSCRGVDKPIAGLLTDLRQRGLLDDTLVLWSGEFGRTPVWQSLNKNQPAGRGHNPFGFSRWMAGGGVKGGFAYGQTDEFGYSAVSQRVHVHDLHATLLHLLGLDHEKVTFRYSGRDFRLTDVYGRVAKEILA